MYSETRWKAHGFLTRRVYEADPLLRRCGQKMRVLGFITQSSVIRKILDYVSRRFEPLMLPGRETRKKKFPISFDKGL